MVASLVAEGGVLLHGLILAGWLHGRRQALVQGPGRFELGPVALANSPLM